MAIMARVIFGRLTHVVYDLRGKWGRQWHWGTYNYTAIGPWMLWSEQVSPLFCITFVMFLHLKCRVGRGISVPSHLPIISQHCQLSSLITSNAISNVCLFLWTSFHVFFYFSCPLDLFPAFVLCFWNLLLGEHGEYLPMQLSLWVKYPLFNSTEDILQFRDLVIPTLGFENKWNLPPQTSAFHSQHQWQEFNNWSFDR